MKSFVGNPSVRIIENNKLVIRWWDDVSKRCYSQGKRVKKNIQFPRKYIRIYVKSGIMECVKAIRKDNPFLSIYESCKMIDKARL